MFGAVTLALFLLQEKHCRRREGHPSRRLEGSPGAGEQRQQTGEAPTTNEKR